MARLTYQQLELIKEKMNVKQIWSFSKMSTFSQCTWAYFLRYIQKIRVKGDNCYTVWGTNSHDIIQGFYEDEFTYEGMLVELEQRILDYLMADDKKLKFPNDSEWESYIANIRHYFTNTEVIPYKVVNEKPVLAEFKGIEKYIFQGYIDSEYYDEQNNFVILDYKTSSMSGFTGKKLIEKAQQLIIYAFGVSKFRKIPMEKIRIRYDMMKYCNVTFMQKNGKEKTSKAERRLWVAHMANQIRKDLQDVPKEIEKVNKEIAKLERKLNLKKTTEEEKPAINALIEVEKQKIVEIEKDLFDVVTIDDMITTAINENNLDNMPPFVKNKYKVGNCYIDVELTPEVLEEVESQIVDTLNKIIKKTEAENHEEAFTRGKIENSDSYYCVNLCDMRDHCKFYKEFKEHNAMFLEKEAPSDEQILAMLGL
ncbi:PD-(D/E)XK nuclease family protein [Bacillus gaemokensis]|uniref:PD-(D/E)XK endonuclease-like domain-containing protein n=1 Tax=Bacillus gaemokensis TaxID=574375 RepID=A0A073KBT0_9BACI|nr:PD-(D/E)XK nuclease family protein [Bacillus gaemokensis]KEK23907.1 hypothetical protein BAGA_05610 [Bacillus gaemokensis]KYG38150.1 hypothetical protein AZF08_20600 [Bacillus gaemokensis]